MNQLYHGAHQDHRVATMDFQLNDPSLLKYQGFIDGRWLDAADTQTFAVSNPANGQHLGDVANMGAAQTGIAIEAAQAAQTAWQAESAQARSAILERWHQLVIDNQADLARIMTIEQGKPLCESMGEIAYGAAFIKWFSEEGKRVYGSTLPAAQSDRRAIAIKQPVGVVAAITPWNFPHAMITRKVAPALAVGCTVVLKPAAETPFSALALAELARRAGVPAGVFNVVPGIDAAAIGGELTRNPRVRKLTFTGSTPVGKLLMQQCAATVKRTSMELGGNAPLIIFDDADLNMAMAGVLLSKFRNSGQTCICSNRIIVQDGIYDEFVTRLAAAVAEFRFGDGLDAASTHGPLISAQAAAGIHAKVEDAVARGANVMSGGRISDLGSHFYEPTILTNVDHTMAVFREEIFGPVAPIFKFSTEEQAIAMANDTEFGLAAYFYSESIARSWRVAEALEYGMVGVNETAISSEVIPFGGIKESGQGREGSKFGLDDYLEIKYICMGGLSR